MSLIVLEIVSVVFFFYVYHDLSLTNRSMPSFLLILCVYQV
jgi:hypothetical protein